MSIARTNRRRWIVLVAFLMLFIGAPCFLYNRELHHMKLNRQLIAALHDQNEERALALLCQGADGFVNEADAKPLTAGEAILSIRNSLLHRGPREGFSTYANGNSRSGLQLYYSCVLYNYYPDREEPISPIPDERVPLALLDAGASVKPVNNDWINPLPMALMFHHHNVVRRILGTGAPVNYNDRWGNPIFCADVEDTRLLISHGAKFDDASPDGETPLFGADGAKAEFLINLGARIDRVDRLKQTPLIRACTINGRNSAISVLLAHHADVRIVDRLGATALLHAAKNRSLETIQNMIRAGADIQAVDASGDNALIWSTVNHDSRVAKWLIAQGLNVNSQDMSGNTALSVAEFNLNKVYPKKQRPPEFSLRYNAMIQFLKSNGATIGKPGSIWSMRRQAAY